MKRDAAVSVTIKNVHCSGAALRLEERIFSGSNTCCIQQEILKMQQEGYLIRAEHNHKPLRCHYMIAFCLFSCRNGSIMVLTLRRNWPCCRRLLSTLRDTKTSMRCLSKTRPRSWDALYSSPYTSSRGQYRTDRLRSTSRRGPMSRLLRLAATTIDRINRYREAILTIFFNVIIISSE